MSFSLVDPSANASWRVRFKIDLGFGVPAREGVLETDPDLTLLPLAADVNGVMEVELGEPMASSMLGVVGRLKESSSS
jgi:hypothetical protein